MISKKNKTWLKGTLLIVGITIGVSILVLGVDWFTEFVNKENKLVGLQYIKQGNNERVVAVYQKTTYGRRYSILYGYTVKLIDPVSQKVINELFIKNGKGKKSYGRTIGSFDVPTIIRTNQNEIWLIRQADITYGDPDYVMILKIENDQFTKLGTEFLNNWNIQDIGNTSASLSNKYNELGCLNYSTHLITDSKCDNDEENQPQMTKNQSQTISKFFFVKNKPGSNRSQIFYYHADTIFPPAVVYVGSADDGEVLPSYHLSDVIDMGDGYVSKDDLAAYSKKFATIEILRTIYDKEFLINPAFLYENEIECLLLTGEEDKWEFWYFHHSEGALKWKYPCPQLKYSMKPSDYDCKEDQKNIIISDNQNWIISIDKASGKLNWKYPD